MKQFLRIVVALVWSLSLTGAAEQTSEARVIALGNDGKENVTFWLATSLKRIFPQTPPGAAGLELLAARNSRIAFQIAYRNNQTRMIHVTCDVKQAEDLKPQVRFVGLTPVHHVTLNTPLAELDGAPAHLPGLVPDSLWPLKTAEVCPYESRSSWVTLTIPPDAKPGKRTLEVRVSFDGGKQQATLPVQLTISSLVVRPRRDFPVIHWWRPEANWDQYKTEMFDEKWWSITRAQMENMLAHGSDVAYVPVLFNLGETFKRPGQMLIVRQPKSGVYEFDWSRVKRFTDLCKEVGFRQFEWSHLWSCFTVAHPTRVYELKDGQYLSIWPREEPALSPRFQEFMKQYLPALREFLAKEGLLEHSYFHLADEPLSEHIENYRKARKFLHDHAPWMKVMDALSDVRYGKEKLTDMPIPLIDSAQAYIDAGIPHWVYYCCVPQGAYLNRFMDTPLPKIRMAGWTFYRLGAKGFLHWGFNYWNKIDREEPMNPFHEAASGCAPMIPYGDGFVIYPGPDGKPLDSIRWEVFAESLQDYAILQTAGIKPEDVMLNGINSYRDFPKSEEWLDQTLRKILLK
jgi:hypothetical protein